MKTMISFLLALLPFGMMAQTQDYVMYETQYLKPKPGHYGQLMEKLAEHNQKYHKEGPLAAYVFFVTSGPRSHQLAVVNGPCTYADLDDRGGGREHFLDWFDGVMSHCEDSEIGTEYWVRNDELSYMPETDGEPRPIQMVRFFEVTDNALFVKVQKQIMEVRAQTPEFKDLPRVMWRRDFMTDDNRQWAITVTRKNWASLDENQPSGTFMEAFKKVHGEAAWATFAEEFQQAVTSREDEWRMLMEDLNGPQPAEASRN